MLLTPMDGLKVRATFAEGFRAPSIGALYSGNADSFPTLQDPCDVLSANFTGNADGTQVGQCLADGVPTGFTQPNDQIRITVGGNPCTTRRVRKFQRWYDISVRSGMEYVC